MSRQSVIPIFFTTDEHYAPYLSVAIISLIEHSNPQNRYEINIVYHHLRYRTRRKIARLARQHKHIKVIFSPMQKSIEGISDRKETRLKADHFTPTIYYRLFLPEIFRHYDRAIYLDCDTLILTDVANLYQIKLDKHPIAACPDTSTQGNKLFARYFKDAVGVDPQKYFNSGVLLMDFQKLRAEEFCEHFLYLLNTYDFDTVAPDQDYLNAMLKNRVKYLPSTWNTMPSAPHAEKTPNIIHYNLFFKPWHYDNTPYGEYFWQYAAKTPFIRQIQREKRNFGKKNAKTDDQRLALMSARVQEILDGKHSFKKIAERNKKGDTK